MSQDVYIKQKNGRYKRIGQPFRGFPCDGVWLVKDGSENLIMQVGDVPNPMPLAQLQLWKHDICKYFLDNENVYNKSISDMVDGLLMYLAECEQNDTEYADCLIKGLMETFKAEFEYDSRFKEWYGRMEKAYRIIHRRREDMGL